MIKKAVITEAYQVNMYCDKCGKRMAKDDNLTKWQDPILFGYRCECGHVEYSTHIYPTQQVVFDEANAVEHTWEGEQ